MLATHSKTEIIYPERDGKPMGETDIHRDLIIFMIDWLQQAFPKAYVSGNICLYYEEGNPKKMISPDTLLCRSQAPQRKRVYKAWEDNAQLDLVFEFSSWSTKREDHNKKKQIYQDILKVPYYVIYDPQAIYLNVFELQEEGYRQLEAETTGRCRLEKLGLQIGVGPNATLALYQGENRLLTASERVEQEAERADQAESKNREMQEQLKALQEKLSQLENP